MLSRTPALADDSAADAGAAETSAAALHRLMAWLSPAYPVGAFSYSSGLEWAIEAGDVGDRETLETWIAATLRHGAGFCDAVFLMQAHAATAAGETDTLRAIAELAAAFTPSKERHLETTAQGQAFIQTTRAAWPCAALDAFVASWPGPYAYPVAVAVAAAGHGVRASATVNAYLHGLTANMISAGVRLIPLGQTDGQRTLAALEPVISETAARAATTPLDDIGSATLRADIASMRHETQYTRLFRS